MLLCRNGILVFCRMGKLRLWVVDTWQAPPTAGSRSNLILKFEHHQSWGLRKLSFRLLLNRSRCCRNRGSRRRRYTLGIAAIWVLGSIICGALSFFCCDRSLLRRAAPAITGRLLLHIGCHLLMFDTPCALPSRFLSENIADSMDGNWIERSFLKRWPHMPLGE